jgi:hypothetical protein
LTSVAGAGVATTRIGNAAHGVLSERCGDRAEAEEGSECKCEREFHDPAPLVGIARKNWLARRQMGLQENENKLARCVALSQNLCMTTTKKNMARAFIFAQFSWIDGNNAE